MAAFMSTASGLSSSSSSSTAYTNTPLTTTALTAAAAATTTTTTNHSYQQPSSIIRWEYAMHGAVRCGGTDAAALHARLGGLTCGSGTTAGVLSQGMEFCVRDNVYRSTAGDKATRTGSTVYLHVRHNQKENTWQILHYGQLKTIAGTPPYKDQLPGNTAGWGVMTRPLRRVESLANPSDLIAGMGMT